MHKKDLQKNKMSASDYTCIFDGDFRKHRKISEGLLTTVIIATHALQQIGALKVGDRAERQP